MERVILQIRDCWIGELELSSLFLFLEFFATLLVLLLLLTSKLAVLRFMGERVVAMVLTPMVRLPVFLQGSFATGGLLSLPGCDLELTLAFPLSLSPSAVGVILLLAWWLRLLLVSAWR